VPALVNGGAALVPRKRCGDRNHRPGLKLQGAKCNRDARFARSRTSSRLENAGGRSLSSHDPQTAPGIGKAKSIRIRWPKSSGRVRRFKSPLVNRCVTTVEGKDLS
jgi:hypothetical protein